LVELGLTDWDFPRNRLFYTPLSLSTGENKDDGDHLGYYAPTVDMISLVTKGRLNTRPVITEEMSHRILSGSSARVEITCLEWISNSDITCLSLFYEDIFEGKNNIVMRRQEKKGWIKALKRKIIDYEGTIIDFISSWRRLQEALTMFHLEQAVNDVPQEFSGLENFLEMLFRKNLGDPIIMKIYKDLLWIKKVSGSFFVPMMYAQEASNIPEFRIRGPLIILPEFMGEKQFYYEDDKERRCDVVILDAREDTKTYFPLTKEYMPSWRFGKLTSTLRALIRDGQKISAELFLSTIIETSLRYKMPLEGLGRSGDPVIDSLKEPISEWPMVVRILYRPYVENDMVRKHLYTTKSDFDTSETYPILDPSLTITRNLDEPISQIWPRKDLDPKEMAVWMAHYHLTNLKCQILNKSTQVTCANRTLNTCLLSQDCDICPVGRFFAMSKKLWKWWHSN